MVTDKQPTRYLHSGKMEDALRLLRIHGLECPDTRIRLPQHKWPNSWANIEDPAVPLERNLCGHPNSQASCGKDNSRKFFWNLEGQSTELGMSFRSSKTRIVLVGIRVDDIQVAGNKQILAPMREKLMKKTLILTNQFYFLITKTWDVFNVNVNRTKSSLRNIQNMFESRISAGATEK